MSSSSDHADSTAVDSRKGAWTAREDAALSARVAKYGTKSWTTIASGVEGRSAKSCRLRWYNQLCPGVKRTPFSEWEQAVIIKAQKIHTNKWAALAKLLKGRTDNAIKNHWNATLSRKLNNPAENFRNQFIEQGVTLEWLLGHPELDTSNDIEEALAARNYNSKIGLAALKGIKKKKRRSTPSSPSYSGGMTPTATSSRPSKFQVISKRQSALEPSAESALTGSCHQTGAVSLTGLPAQLLAHQQHEPVYDSYSYSFSAVPLGSSGGGLSSSSFSVLGGSVASLTGLGHTASCMALAGGPCSCWQGSTPEAQGHSAASLSAPGAPPAGAGGYVSYSEGGLQPLTASPWQPVGSMSDVALYGTAADVSTSSFQAYGGEHCTQEISGSSSKLQAVSAAPHTSQGANPGIAIEQQHALCSLQDDSSAACLTKQEQHLQQQQQPSNSNVSSGSPVRPGLVNSCGTTTPPPNSCTDKPHTTSNTTAADSSPQNFSSSHTGPGANLDRKGISGLVRSGSTGAWATQGLSMGPPSDSLGPLGLRPLGQGKLLSPAAYDMLMSGVVPSTRSVDLQYKNGAAAATTDSNMPRGPLTSSLMSPGLQGSDLQLQHSMPAPTTAFNSSGGGYGPPSASLERPSRPSNGLGRSFSYDVSAGGFPAPNGPPPGPHMSAPGPYGLPPGPGPAPAYMGGPGGRNSGGGFDPSQLPPMQRMNRSYSTPPGYHPPVGPYSRTSGGGGCGVPGCTDTACWGYAGPDALPGPPGMLPPGLPTAYGSFGGAPGPYPSGPGPYPSGPGPYPPGPGQIGMLASYGSAPAPGNAPQGRRSGSASGFADGLPPGVHYGSRSAGGALDPGPMFGGLPPPFLADAPHVSQTQPPGMGVSRKSGSGAMLGGSSLQQYHPPLQQQQQHSRQPQQQRQQPPGTPAFSWDSVGEALQGFGEGAVDSLPWGDLPDFDLSDLKQHEVDELLNF